MDKEDGNVDFISDLPPDIIKMILARVGTKEAIKTSLLSKAWRYRWCTIPDLMFEDTCDSMETEGHFIQFVTFCLLLHQGPINKFFLVTSFLQCTRVIDQWLLHLSRNDVKELRIDFFEENWFTAPSCLFSCSKLTYLELFRCELYPPPSFQGFLFLKVLCLRLFEMPPDDFQKLISSCPLLVNLTLCSSTEMKLTLSAPYLEYLSLHGPYKDIYLENTPLLVEVGVTEYMTEEYMNEGAAEIFGNRRCNFDRFFGGTSRLERLVGQVYFTKYLSKGLDRSSMSKQYDHLKSIALEIVCSEDMHEVSVLLRLLVDSPNLKNLFIWGVLNPSTDLAPDLAPDSNFWERQCPEKYMFNKLETVKFSDTVGRVNEMKFIKFILERSPVLETLTIVTFEQKLNTLQALNMLIALTRFRRASAQAELIFDRL